MMKNTLMDLNNYLFEQIERLNDDDLDDESLDREIKKADAMVKVSNTIIENGALQLRAMSYADEYGYDNKGRGVFFQQMLGMNGGN